MIPVIPGFLINLMTFPGVIFHELGHKWFCQWTGVAVYEVCYFSLKTNNFGGGYVIHEKPTKFYQAFFITLGPFITGTIISLLVFVLYELTALVHPRLVLLELILAWLGMSIAMQSFPSTVDANNLWEETDKRITKNPLAVIGYPFVLFIYIANLLSFLWFDLFYACILVWLVITFLPW